MLTERNQRSKLMLHESTYVTLCRSLNYSDSEVFSMGWLYGEELEGIFGDGRFILNFYV